MSERDVTIEVLFEKILQQSPEARVETRMVEWKRGSRAGEGKRAKVPEIGLSLFKWPLGEPPSRPPLCRSGFSSPLLSTTFLPFARSGDPRERSRVGRWKRRRRRRMGRKNAFDGASAKTPPNRSLLARNCTRKTVIPVQRFRKNKIWTDVQLRVGYIFTNW